MSTRDQRPAAGGDSDWLTLGQAAKFLGVAQSTIRKWSDQGRLPAFYTPGGHRRYRRADLDAFLERSGPGKPARGPMVLVVDDDAQVREVVRINLEMEGYAVREAANAEEGLAALEEDAPDLILLDVIFEGLSWAGRLGLVWIAIAAVLALVWRRYGVPVLTVVAVAVADWSATGLKAAFDIERPSSRYAEPRPLVHPPTDGAFPS